MGSQEATTISRATRSRGGFTLAELTVVVFTLVLFASVILPNLSGARENQKEKDFRTNLRTVLSRARIEAVSSGRITTFRFDEANASFILEREPAPAQTSSTNTPPQTIANPASTDPPEQLETLQAPDVIQFNKYVLSNQEVASGEWAVRFYPDGSDDGAGLEFSVGLVNYAINIDKNGRIDWSDQLPQPEDVRWPAGDYETR